MPTASLAGKVALVTGCGPNINGGIACGLAEEGVRLVCIDRRADYAEASAAAIRGGGGAAVAVSCDVTDEAQVRAAIAAAQAAFGGVDILVNGAAVQHRKGLLDLPAEAFRRQIEVSLSGAFLCTQHAARAMIARARRGSIVNIVSTEGHQGNRGNIGYGTAKAGLLNFTRAAAMDLAEHGIRVNSLTPTATDPAENLARAAAWGVDWQQEPLGPRRADTTAGDEGVPLGKRPSPSHYARAVAFLVSDDAAMITGADLRVDGGTLARYWRWNPGARIEPAG